MFRLLQDEYVNGKHLREQIRTDNTLLPVTTSGDVGITPCNLGASENTFVCGLDSTQCTTSSKTFTLASDLSLVLRPDEVATLVGPALAAASAHPGSGWFSTGQLLGVALGIALPLLLALGILGYLFVKERRPKRKSMLKLPDESNESRFSFQPPPVLGETLQHRASRASQATQASGRSNRSTTSRRPSLRSMNSNGSHRRDHPPRSPTIASPRPTLSPNVSSYHEPQRLHSYAESRPSQVPSFAERFEAMKVTPQLVDVRDSSQSRHELDSSPSTPREVERFELATARMSR